MCRASKAAGDSATPQNGLLKALALSPLKSRKFSRSSKSFVELLEWHHADASRADLLAR
jgi:hypothetical protein